RNLMFAPFVALTIRGLRTASPPQRRLFMVGVFYLVLASVFGYWNEVRLWLPVFALWLPALGNEVAQVALEVGAARVTKERRHDVVPVLPAVVGIVHRARARPIRRVPRREHHREIPVNRE